MNEVEQLVIKNLLLDEEYVRKALPFIKSEYFSELTGRKLFTVVTKYFTDYSAIPTKEALKIEVGQVEDISDDQHKDIVKAIDNIDAEYDACEEYDDATSAEAKEICFGEDGKDVRYIIIRRRRPIKLTYVFPLFCIEMNRC